MSESTRTVPCPKCGGSGMVECSTRTVFGMNVQRIRKAKGWTQEDLARKVPVTRTQIANIESGRGGTTLDGLMDFANALECSPNELLATPEREEPE